MTAWDELTGQDAAIALLREGRGSHFDGDCVDALLHAWSEVQQIRTRFHDGGEPAFAALAYD